MNRQILKKRLSKDGHEVVAVVHGGDAMRLLEKDQAWDLVLMDLMMPVRIQVASLFEAELTFYRLQIMGGLETTEAIREREANHPLPHAQLRPSTILNGRLPVIAVSASLPESNKSQIVDAGFGEPSWPSHSSSEHWLTSFPRSQMAGVSNLWM